jgi:predicted dehydrogenase/threonine dehydrogenase-like Zn-dependent dehydrogenase
MRQVLQNLRSGHVELAGVPCPSVRPGHLLVQSSRTLVSPGTERMLVEFGKASLLAKARSQPERVGQVLTKIRTDGLVPTLETVFSRLDEPLPLGYCNVGRVVAVGNGVAGFAAGDRVASNGPHAEVVCVPATLAARVPEVVDDEAASFTVPGAIALQGIRLLEPTLGESFAVVGLGLLGMLALQLLRAHGARVIGIDVDPARCELARALGCDATAVASRASAIRAAQVFSRERGVDGVLITASAKNDDIVHQAASMCRKRGRIVLVGVVDLDLRRGDFYEKELSFQVSCSYGPGRYDPAYEAAARDYPLPFVRWTAARNFEAVLEALADKRIEVAPLVSRRIAQADAASAYDALTSDKGLLGVVLAYPEQALEGDRLVRLPGRIEPAPTRDGARSAPVEPVVGVIGAGGFSRMVLLPAIAASGVKIHSIASGGGVTSLHAARKFGAHAATADYRAILESAAVNTVFVATRHDSHARMATEALDAGKHVFVEKPLAIDEAGLELVRGAHARHPELQLMVGFNRRFAPHAVKVRELLAGRAEPVALHLLVNAGRLPAGSWLDDPDVGGGRIVGEACHFIDLAMFLVGHPITTVHAETLGRGTPLAQSDCVTLALTFDDGSLATVHYWTNGSKSYPKERVEVFSEGRVLVIDNWRRLTGFDWPAPALRMRQDKGHGSEVAQFLAGVAAGRAAPIPFDELDGVARASFAARRSAAEGRTIDLRVASESAVEHEAAPAEDDEAACGPSRQGERGPGAHDGDAVQPAWAVAESR